MSAIARAWTRDRESEAKLREHGARIGTRAPKREPTLRVAAAAYNSYDDSAFTSRIPSVGLAMRVQCGAGGRRSCWVGGGRERGGGAAFCSARTSALRQMPRRPAVLHGGDDTDRGVPSRPCVSRGQLDRHRLPARHVVECDRPREHFGVHPMPGRQCVPRWQRAAPAVQCGHTLT